MEKLFEYRSYSSLAPYSANAIWFSILDGAPKERRLKYHIHGNEQYLSLSDEIIRKIREILDDDLLFEVQELEDSPRYVFLDGYTQHFSMSLNGRKNEMWGSNIEVCRGDYQNCVHAAHAIDALERLRDILVPLGAPESIFQLSPKESKLKK